MNKLIAFLAALLCINATAREMPKFKTETLDRGLIAIKNGNNAFLSWRLFGDDPTNIRFNIYQNDGTTAVSSCANLDAAHTNCTVTNGAGTGVTYKVAAVVDGVEKDRSAAVSVWQDGYLKIPVQKPTGRVWNSSAWETYTAYSIGDGTAADLDGDGQYEIIFFWVPDNLKDNSQSGHTANVFIDAYKLNGTKLWGAGKWIDMGPNIRAGAHYNTFVVYDFDGDGKAEIIIKTADGTKDALGTRIGNDTRYSNNDGYVLTGAEFLSVFEGATGKMLKTEDFQVARGTVSGWGDGYGNRVDRFLSTVAYLDGERPSAVMARGYYKGQNNAGRTGITAWDWNGTNLTRRWTFDTQGMTNGSTYTGQGYHALSVGDVNGDGKDEIIYGSMVISSTGTVLYSKGFGHGDAMHVSMFDPAFDGLIFMGVHEEANGSSIPRISVREAGSGNVIYRNEGEGDIGRGLIADIDSTSPGAELWSASNLGVFSVQGGKAMGGNGNLTINMATHWGGGTGPRYLFDGNISKVNASGTIPNRTYSRAVANEFTGSATGGGTKKNPVLQADILGDWREEILLRNSNNTELRIYSTNIPTEHTGAGAIPSVGIPTLMHDREYRLAVSWQNSGYNQPPHTGFFIGYHMNTMPIVVFQSEGKALSRQQVPAGKPVIKPANPTRAGYTFQGWNNGNTAWNFSSNVTQHMTLTAQWQSGGTPSSSSVAPSSSSSVPSSSSVTPSSSSSVPSSSSVTPNSSSSIPSSSSAVQSSNSLCEGTETFWNFTQSEFTDALPPPDEETPNNNITESYTINGLTIVYGNAAMSYTENFKTIDDYDFSYRFQLGGTGSPTNRALKFDVNGACNVVVYGIAGNSGSTRALALSDGTTELQTVNFPGNAISKGIYTYEGDATSLYLYSKDSGINIYGVKVINCGDGGDDGEDDDDVTPIALPKISQSSNALSAMQSAVGLQTAGNTTVQVYDLKGNIIRSLKFGQGNHVVSLSDLPRGLYIVKASNASWKKTVKVNVI